MSVVGFKLPNFITIFGANTSQITTLVTDRQVLRGVPEEDGSRPVQGRHSDLTERVRAAVGLPQRLASPAANSSRW
jgi:hypothetical protein